MAWSIWECAKCGAEIELNDNATLEAWCARCRRALEAVVDDQDVDDLPP